MIQTSIANAKRLLVWGIINNKRILCLNKFEPLSELQFNILLVKRPTMESY